MKCSTLLANALTGTGRATNALDGSKHFNFSIQWGVGTTAGVVVVETAPNDAFAGTWFVLKTFTWATPNTIDVAREVGPFNAIRARVTTTVTTTDAGVTVTMTEN